ncbi:MAG: hypothetical protein JWM95_1731 [Gemmatimonadetes bacterium]|nr:hypothetical protein [Gemmatimonadota bacterium]
MTPISDTPVPLSDERITELRTATEELIAATERLAAERSDAALVNASRVVGRWTSLVMGPTLVAVLDELSRLRLQGAADAARIAKLAAWMETNGEALIYPPMQFDGYMLDSIDPDADIPPQYETLEELLDALPAALSASHGDTQTNT